MNIGGKWVSDTEVEAIRHLLERAIPVAGLAATEMNALRALSRKGFVDCAGGNYKANLRLLTALTERMIRKGRGKIQVTIAA